MVAESLAWMLNVVPGVRFEGADSATLPTPFAGRATTPDELLIPGFMERDEGEREKPYDQFPWEGVSGTRPFHEFAKTTTVGVY